MKSYLEPLTVTLDAHQNPAQLTWRNHLYLVTEIQERWRLRTQWWGSEIMRSYFRVTTRAAKGGQVVDMEIYESASQWTLVSIQD